MLSVRLPQQGALRLGCEHEGFLGEVTPGSMLGKCAGETRRQGANTGRIIQPVQNATSAFSPREGGSWGIDTPVPSSQSLVESCPRGIDPLAFSARVACWRSVLPQPETKPAAGESQVSS